MSDPGADSATVETVMRRWEARCSEAEAKELHPWPESSARSVIQGLLLGLTNDEEWALQQAAAAFAKATTSVPLLTLRLGCLRHVLIDEGGVRPDIASRIGEMLDTVAAISTKTALEELEDAALTDALTQAGNRRSLEMAATAALATTSRTKQPLTVVAIDVDGLKTINDTQGHASGDRALSGLATAVRGAMRQSDQLFRIGGDEFVLLLPLASSDAVPALVERARQLDAPRFSWGAATAPADGSRLETLLTAADNQLYEIRRATGYQRASRPAVPAGRGLLSGTRQHWVRAALAAAISVAAVLGLVALSSAFSAGGSPSKASVTTTTTTFPPNVPGGAPPGSGGAVGVAGSPSGSAGGGSSSASVGSPPPPPSPPPAPPAGSNAGAGTGSNGGSSSSGGSGSQPKSPGPSPLTTVTLPLSAG